MTDPQIAPERSLARRWLVPFAVVGAIVAALIVATTVLSSEDPPPPASVSEFAMNGSVTVNGGHREIFVEGVRTPGKPCIGQGGYNDMRLGAQVTVSSPSREVIAIGTLTRSGLTNTGCAFAFTVPGVPKGHDFYLVEVTHRGAVTVDAATAEAGEVRLTLG